MFVPAQLSRKTVKALIVGEPGSGKTKLGLTFPNVGLVDTEHGADWVEGDHKVLHTRNPARVLLALEGIHKGSEDIGTLMIDSGSPVWTNVMDAFLNKGHLREWIPVKRMWGKLIGGGMSASVNLVVTARMTSIYEKTTGESGKTEFRIIGRKPAIEPNTDSEMDLVLEAFVSVEKNKIPGADHIVPGIEPGRYCIRVLKDRMPFGFKTGSVIVCECKECGGKVSKPTISYALWGDRIRKKKIEERKSVSPEDDAAIERETEAVMRTMAGGTEGISGKVPAPRPSPLPGPRIPARRKDEPPAEPAPRERGGVKDREAPARGSSGPPPPVPPEKGLPEGPKGMWQGKVFEGISLAWQRREDEWMDAGLPDLEALSDDCRLVGRIIFEVESCGQLPDDSKDDERSWRTLGRFLMAKFRTETPREFIAFVDKLKSGGMPDSTKD